MADFDETLNSLLSNPDAMSQIMQLAQSLSGGQQIGPSPPEQNQGNNRTTPPPPPPSPGGGDFFSSLAQGLDPALLFRLLPLIQELGGEQNSNARQLLYALRPYLKSERQDKIERALQLARLFHVGKRFLSEWEG